MLSFLASYLYSECQTHVCLNMELEAGLYSELWTI